MSSLIFTVYGTPVPQGSMKAFIPPGFSRPIITSDNEKLKPWRNEVAGCALVEMKRNKFERCGRRVPIVIEVTFFFHPTKDRRMVHKTTKPDIDKLLRAMLDALTGIVFEDDAQVTDCILRKRFDSPARVEITINDDLASDQGFLALPPSVPMMPRAIKGKDVPF